VSHGQRYGFLQPLFSVFTPDPLFSYPNEAEWTLVQTQILLTKSYTAGIEPGNSEAVASSCDHEINLIFNKSASS
jgi:hypothetical protein